MARKPEYYLGKANLRNQGSEIDITAEQQMEVFKCAMDPIYFFENYIHIINVDKGKIKFHPYEFQKDIVRKCVDNRFVICKIPRQQGKTTTIAALLVWYILFNKDFKIAVLAHRKEQALEIMGRIQLAYEMLPMWMQQGVKIWNKGDIQLENGSLIEAEATSSGAVRGRSYNIVYLDELAHIEPNVQEDFFTSTYPVITSGDTTKMIITSTPKGLEYFYSIWQKATAKPPKNEYVAVEATWDMVPGRDEAWKQKTISNTSERQWMQEFECDFLGSADTLIDGRKLATLVEVDPISDPKDALVLFEAPQKGHNYVICVDTSRGAGIDYSAFMVIDVSDLPYNVVARYHDNKIASVMYPNKILEAAKLFNNAYVLVENNDVGAQVADILHMDLEYANMFTSQMKGRNGQQLGGLGSVSRQLGMKMTKQTKRVGCAALKTIVEKDKITLNDKLTLMELSTFVVKKQSYEADEGKHDDLVMCLVMFAWLIHQDYFRELIDHDIRTSLEEDTAEHFEQDLTPFGVIDNGYGALNFDMFGNDLVTYDDPDFGKF